MLCNVDPGIHCCKQNCCKKTWTTCFTTIAGHNLLKWKIRFYAEMDAWLMLAASSLVPRPLRYCWYPPNMVNVYYISQLGWWHSQKKWKNKKCSKPPTSILEEEGTIATKRGLNSNSLSLSHDLSSVSPSSHPKYHQKQVRTINCCLAWFLQRCSKVSFLWWDEAFLLCLGDNSAKAANAAFHGSLLTSCRHLSMSIGDPMPELPSGKGLHSYGKSPCYY